MSNNPNNGLITKIWGPGLWIAFHSMTFGYPLNPTNEDKKNYRDYFINIGYVLPCIYCRNSYIEFINSGDTKLTDEVFQSRDNLTYWGYLLHERVNNKLNVSYGVSYPEIVNRYESYRAKCAITNTNGCIVPLDYKKFSYQHYYHKDTIIIPEEISSAFYSMGKQRGFPITFLKLHNLIKKYIPNLVKLKQDKLWRIRNRVTNEIIINMRLRGESCIDDKEPWKDYPSLNELALLLLFSTSMENDLLMRTYNKWIKDSRYK